VDSADLDADTPTPAAEQVEPEGKVLQGPEGPAGETPPVAADIGVPDAGAEGDEGTSRVAGAEEEPGKGLPALRVTEIVLGVLLAGAVAGAAGVSFVQRRRG